MCLIYNPDAAAVLLPRGHTATAAVADPRAWGSFCIVVDVPPAPIAMEGTKGHHACAVAEASGVRVSHRGRIDIAVRRTASRCSSIAVWTLTGFPGIHIYKQLAKNAGSRA